MSATSGGGGGGGGGSVSEGSDAGESSQSTMSVSDSPSTSFQKHVDNVTKISLIDGSGSDGFNVDITGSKMNLTLDERQQKDGIVNMGFDYEEGANRGEGGTDFKSMNGSETKDKVPEAVNLELVNMVPYSNGNGTNYGVPVNGIPGIPTKKDSEQVDTSTPYDEYFVPVNEHKKYMRGEKLYVTKDKRRPTSWRRCMSWIVACTVISVVLIVAILAGTGVILSQGPNMVQEASVGRNFAGSNLKPSVTQQMSAPTAEKYTYVPRSIESELVIDNLDFDPALQSINSSSYQQFTKALEDQLKMILFDRKTLEQEASDIGLKIVNVSQNPFKVNYRIGWNYKQGVNNPPEPIKMEDVKRRLVESLAKNQGFIDKYHIDSEAIKVNHVTNKCQFDNGGCSHICYYNYITQQFTCTCPTHLILDSSGKNCAQWSGFDDDAVPVPSRPSSYESTSSSILQPGHGDHPAVQHQYEKTSPESEPEPKNQNDRLPQSEAEPSPVGKDEYYMNVQENTHSLYDSKDKTISESETEPSTVPKSKLNDSHSVYGNEEHQDVGKPTSEPVLEPSAEPSSEPAPEPAPEPAAEPIPESVPEPSAEPSSEPAPELAPEPAAEPIPKSPPEPTAEPIPEPAPEPAAEPIPEPAPEPTADSNSEPTPKPTSEPAAEPIPEPAPEPTADSNSEPTPKPTSEPAAEPIPEPAPEPTADSNSEPTPKPTSEPAAEPSLEPAFKPPVDLSLEPASEPSIKPSFEPPVNSSSEYDTKIGLTSETFVNSNQELHIANRTSDKELSEPTTEPVLESSAKPVPESTSEPTAEPSPSVMPSEQKVLSHEVESTPATEITAEPALHYAIDQNQDKNLEHSSTSADELEKKFNVYSGNGFQENEPNTELSEKAELVPGAEDDPSIIQRHKGSVASELEHEQIPEPTHQPSAEKDKTTSAVDNFETGVQPQKTGNAESRLPDVQRVIQQEHVDHSKTQTTTESGTPAKHHKHLEDILVRKLPASKSASDYNPLENVEVTFDGKPIIEEIEIDNSRSKLVTQPEETTHAVMFGLDTHGDSAQVPGMTENVYVPSTEAPVLKQKEIKKANEKIPVSENVPIPPEIVRHVKTDATPGNMTIISDKNQSFQPGAEKTESQRNSESVNQEGVTTTNPHYESHTVPVNVISFEHEENTQAQTFGPILSRQTEYPQSIKESPHESEGEKNYVVGGTNNAHDLRTTSRPGVTELINEENSVKKYDDTAVTKSETENNETTSPEELFNSVKDLDNETFNTLVDKEYKTKSEQSENKYPNKQLKVEKKKIKDYVKNEKTTIESTIKPPVTPEDFILQKHVNGNIFDLDYSLQNEHTTKHDDEVIDGHEIDGVPGVLLKPHGVSNHDISVLQTVAPDFRTETIYPGITHEWETKPDLKAKADDFKPEKEYKFDKDYKFDKQKVGKKKELKKKGGGKDGKNVELDDARKLFGDIAKDDEIMDSDVAVNSFDNFTVQPGAKLIPASNAEIDVHQETTILDGPTALRETEGTTEHSVESVLQLNHPESRGPVVYSPVDKTGHLLVDEPMVSTTDIIPGTVYDGMVQTDDPIVKHIIMNTTLDTTPDSIDADNTTFVLYQTTDSLPIVTDGINSTTAHPTIIVHGQSGNLQDGHVMRFSNSTMYNPSNATVISVFKGNLTHADGHSFSFTNFTATFPNGSAVHPTIVVHGQSGALQNGHESRFSNSTNVFRLFENSTVYKIENGSVPGTVFDGHFNPQEGNYHMFTNSSGTFVYRNISAQPFVINGKSGDFGNSKVFFLENNTKALPENSVIFRNSTVFAVDDITGSSFNVEIKEVTEKPQDVASSGTFQGGIFGTAYKVNDYFGYVSKCAAGQFQCINGTSKRGSACISLSSKCDSINDCSDGSDELGCIENGCPGNFQCSDGSCVKRNLVCNGIVDCSDGSDEKNCENWKCEFDEFQCPSGRCIPVVWQCDNKPDCDNHTDEFNCQTSCGNDEYFCPEGWCVPLTYKCNGVKECSNGEDEQLCDCSHEEFKCQTGGCVSMIQVCNGLDDCPDRSDEWDCIKLETDSNLLKIRNPLGNYEPMCADNWSPGYSDEVCASLGYFSSSPIENENNVSSSTFTSYYKLKNESAADFNKKVLVNFRRTNETCSSGKLVEISCQEFTCGSRSMTDISSVEARLVGGMSATAGQWPSVALLYNTRTLHSCTANVITPRWVLASYNCLKMGNKNLNEQDWKLFGGSTVFEMEKEEAETRRIASVIPHPQVKFNQFLFSNDLALVELDQPIQFSSNIGAVCLPEREIQPRQICVTAGWGMNSPIDKSMRQQLQYLPVPTMNLTECNSTEHYSGFITEDKICAGYNAAQKSLCYNEEGAPLMCVNDRGEWELQGVMSYHSNCGRGSHPSIFSSITPVKDWIKKTIGNNFGRKISIVTNR